jgi:hypothetical protein
MPRILPAAANLENSAATLYTFLFRRRRIAWKQLPLFLTSIATTTMAPPWHHPTLAIEGSTRTVLDLCIGDRFSLVNEWDFYLPPAVRQGEARRGGHRTSGWWSFGSFVRAHVAIAQSHASVEIDFMMWLSLSLSLIVIAGSSLHYTVRSTVRAPITKDTFSSYHSQSTAQHNTLLLLLLL